MENEKAPEGEQEEISRIIKNLIDAVGKEQLSVMSNLFISMGTLLKNIANISF